MKPAAMHPQTDWQASHTSKHIDILFSPSLLIYKNEPDKQSSGQS